MKIIIIFFFVLFIALMSCVTINPCEYNALDSSFVMTSDNFIEVRIDDGKSGYGLISLNLTYDGLIYRNLDNVSFMNREDMDNKSLSQLQSYLNAIDPIKTLNSFYYMDTNIVSFDRIPLRLTFINSKREYKLIEYEKCNPKIERIIALVNKLIPFNKRKEFLFGNRCK